MSEQRIVSIDITYLVEQALRSGDHRPDGDEEDAGEG